MKDDNKLIPRHFEEISECMWAEGISRDEIRKVSYNTSLQLLNICVVPGTVVRGPRLVPSDQRMENETWRLWTEAEHDS